MAMTSSCISTGHLPPSERVNALVAEAHARFKAIDDGKVADYIPALAKAPRERFAVCVVETSGTAHEAGAQRYSTLMPGLRDVSVSPPLVALALTLSPGRSGLSRMR